MAISAVTSSVQATGFTTYTAPATLQINQTAANAVNIGDLNEQGDIISVSDGGSSAGVQTTNFTIQQGDNIFLSSTFGNPVDAATTQIQLLDSQGNVVADNQGNSQQQAAYTQLTSTGLTPGAGNYSVQVTPLTDAGAPQINLTSLQQQGTSLSVSSQLTASDPTQYYNFSLSNGNNIKLALATTTGSNSAHVQILSSTGQIVADNRGNSFQRQAYADLTSGTGLSASTGDYTVAVSYDSGDVAAQPNVNYNFQLYSGTNYGITYQTNVTPAPANTSAAASVTATSDAQVYGQTAYHTLNEKAQTGVSIGYLAANKTSLNVDSLLTPVDNTDYYNFTFQTGNNLKLSLNNITNSNDPNAVHLQLLDTSGGRVIADNQGTTSQKAAFAELTSSTGLAASPASYVIKATYSSGVSQDAQLQYNFQLYSGTSYNAVYHTSATAQTYENAVLQGDVAGGYSAATATASYLNTTQNGGTVDITSALQALV